MQTGGKTLDDCFAMGLLEELQAQKERTEFKRAVTTAVLNNDLTRAEELLRPFAPQPQQADAAAEPEAVVPAEPHWDFEDSHGWAPLHVAAAHGFVDLIALLLNAGANVASFHRHDGRTALHRAAEGGHAAVVELLLARSAWPGAATTEGCTPLHLAAANGQTECVRMLVNAAAGTLDARSLTGLTPLAMAAMGGHTHTEACAALLDSSANAALPDENGWTPLHHAAAVAAPALCGLLVSRGAAREALTIGKRSPLDVCPVNAVAEVAMAIEEAIALAAAPASAPAAEPPPASKPAGKPKSAKKGKK